MLHTSPKSLLEHITTIHNQLDTLLAPKPTVLETLVFTGATVAQYTVVPVQTYIVQPVFDKAITPVIATAQSGASYVASTTLNALDLARTAVSTTVSYTTGTIYSSAATIASVVSAPFYTPKQRPLDDDFLLLSMEEVEEAKKQSSSESDENITPPLPSPPQRTASAPAALTAENKEPEPYNNQIIYRYIYSSLTSALELAKNGHPDWNRNSPLFFAETKKIYRQTFNTRMKPKELTADELNFFDRIIDYYQAVFNQIFYIIEFRQKIGNLANHARWATQARDNTRLYFEPEKHLVDFQIKGTVALATLSTKLLRQTSITGEEFKEFQDQYDKVLRTAEEFQNACNYNTASSCLNALLLDYQQASGQLIAPEKPDQHVEPIRALSELFKAQLDFQGQLTNLEKMITQSLSPPDVAETLSTCDGEYHNLIEWKKAVHTAIEKAKEQWSKDKREIERIHKRKRRVVPRVYIVEAPPEPPPVVEAGPEEKKEGDEEDLLHEWQVIMAPTPQQLPAELKDPAPQSQPLSLAPEENKAVAVAVPPPTPVKPLLDFFPPLWETLVDYKAQHPYEFWGIVLFGLFIGTFSAGMMIMGMGAPAIIVGLAIADAVIMATANTTLFALFIKLAKVLVDYFCPKTAAAAAAATTTHSVESVELDAGPSNLSVTSIAAQLGVRPEPQPDTVTPGVEATSAPTQQNQEQTNKCSWTSCFTRRR